MQALGSEFESQHTHKGWDCHMPVTPETWEEGAGGSQGLESQPV